MTSVAPTSPQPTPIPRSLDPDHDADSPTPVLGQVTAELAEKTTGEGDVQTFDLRISQRPDTSTTAFDDAARGAVELARREGGGRGVSDAVAVYRVGTDADEPRWEFAGSGIRQWAIDGSPRWSTQLSIDANNEHFPLDAVFGETSWIDLRNDESNPQPTPIPRSLDPDYSTDSPRPLLGTATTEIMYPNRPEPVVKTIDLRVRHRPDSASTAFEDAARGAIQLARGQNASGDWTDPAVAVYRVGTDADSPTWEFGPTTLNQLSIDGAEWSESTSLSVDADNEQFPLEALFGKTSWLDLRNGETTHMTSQDTAES